MAAGACLCRCRLGTRGRGPPSLVGCGQSRNGAVFFSVAFTRLDTCVQGTGTGHTKATARPLVAGCPRLTWEEPTHSLGLSHRGVREPGAQR